ncbi:hypothetical protein FXV83_16130 [Bradyrhizobium hipponense]|uniref:Uncharacterized protein n=1 Tax=Bradyrhizobium hipponense TaxID=2605638 RepID=A0A5S4YNK6_9BRAD|nr:hypothetical protein [Bradyrhizobium hipponense]TYO65462.1 hypothetical protein FXV83_16130 [Bradyrhizobium hipponense]
MHPSVSPGLKRVQDYIREQTSQTTATFSAFEAAVTRAHELYDSMPAELRLRIFKNMHPANYGDDIRTSLFGIIDEEVSLLDAIGVTYGHKLRELVTGVWEGFSPQHFRSAVLSCRTLYEEAAAAKYYGDQAESAIKHLLSTPPSAYRLERMKKLRATNTERLKVLLNDTSSPAKILKTWYAVRKIDWQKPDYFNDHKLDKKDPLYPGFFLSAFKTLKWQHEIPAEYFYALLCEATHPNMLSNTLYVDDASQTDSEQLVYLIRKMPVTIEPYVTLYSFVSVPTVECVKIIDQYIQKIASLRSDLAQYVQKARRVTA